MAVTVPQGELLLAGLLLGSLLLGSFLLVRPIGWSFIGWDSVASDITLLLERGGSGVGCVVMKLKGFNSSLNVTLADRNRRMVTVSDDVRGIRTCGRIVSRAIYVSTASRCAIANLPVVSASVIIITVNRSRNTGIVTATLFGALGTQHLVDHDVGPLRRGILRTVNISSLVLPRGRTTSH